jgi:hypothetical protein
MVSLGYGNKTGCVLVEKASKGIIRNGRVREKRRIARKAYAAA